jgi:transcriptional regulator GlxA family with amidase domain
MKLFSPTDKICTVSILILPESSMMCVASVLEPLRAANRVSGSKLYEWQITSLSGAPVTMTCEVPLAVDSKFNEHLRGDLLIIIGGFNQLKHVPTAGLSIIRKAASGFSSVAGVEAGSWVVARTGLLNGFQATTHWEDFEAFADQFPEIEVKRDRFVVDGKCMTCGGASPAFDMLLDLIRKRNGAAIAMEVASVFIYDEAHSSFDAQPLVSLGKIAQQDARLEQAVRLMEQTIEQPLPVAAIAKRVGVSSNTLESVFKKHVGMTPGRFYLNLRLKAANRMVQDSSLSLREIAVRSGFNSLSAFSRAYGQAFGKSARLVRSSL